MPLSIYTCRLRNLKADDFYLRHVTPGTYTNRNHVSKTRFTNMVKFFDKSVNIQVLDIQTINIQ